MTTVPTKSHSGNTSLMHHGTYITHRKRSLATVGIIIGCFVLVHMIMSSYVLASSRARKTAEESTSKEREGPTGLTNDWLAERLALQLENKNLRRQIEDHSRRVAADEKASPIPDTQATHHATPTPTQQHSSNAMDGINQPPLWLVVGIPTVPRRGEDATHFTDSCLYRTVWSYVTQLASMEGGLGSRISVVVVNHRPGGHAIFNAVKRAILELHLDAYYGAAARQVAFYEGAALGGPPGGYQDDTSIRTTGGDGGDVAAHEPPTAQVRRQSLDVVQMLDHIILQPSRYFLFTEDDFELCRNGVLALQYMTAKAHRNFATVPAARRRLEPAAASAAKAPAAERTAFTALRCGIGLNGIVMHNSKELPDVQQFRHYLLRHYARRPPDHLIVEFFAKETAEAAEYFGPLRRVAAFRHSIFQHTGGRKSTLRLEDAWSTPSCFTELIVPQLFEVEAWDPRQCPDDDLWPCDGDAARSEQSAMGGGIVLRWNVSKAVQVSQHWVVSPE